MTRFHVLAGALAATAMSVAVGIAQTTPPAPAPATPQAAAPAAPTPAQQGPPAPAPLPPALTSCPELAAAVRIVAANDARMRDWPNLTRYREANHSVEPVDVVPLVDEEPRQRAGAAPEVDDPAAGTLARDGEEEVVLAGPGEPGVVQGDEARMPKLAVPHDRGG